MSDHVSIDRMNDALDGALTSAQMASLEEHVARCAACRDEYARLSELLTALGALPRTAAPPTQAREAILRRISSAERASSAPAVVVKLPTARAADGATTRWPRISASVPQVAAATIVVAVVSAAITWGVLRSAGLADDPQLGSPEMAVREAAEKRTAVGAAARSVSLEEGRYDEAVTRLETVLERGQHVLAPETLATIEESLRTVNAAIDEVEAALADDPGSDLLLRLLANHRSTKLGVLQRAAAAVEART